MAGDGVFTVRLMAMTDASRVAKVGLMMRGALDDGASHVSLLVENGGKDLKVVWREKAGVQAAIINSSGDTVLSVPIWLRLVRAGNNITAYQSDNGKAWRIVPGTPLTVQMTGEIYAGMAVCSREDAPTVATFDHVSVPGWESFPAILAGSEQ
jgi:regulation of enolase protein 1 (concanavalin A-like superfamily)